ncbi:unnamed protein product, partial [Effrenium voratum]
DPAAKAAKKVAPDAKAVKAPNAGDPTAADLKPAKAPKKAAKAKARAASPEEIKLQAQRVFARRMRPKTPAALEVWDVIVNVWKIAPSLQFKHNMKSQYQWWDTAHAKVHSMPGARTATAMKDTLLMLAPVFLTGFDPAE